MRDRHIKSMKSVPQEIVIVLKKYPGCHLFFIPSSHVLELIFFWPRHSDHRDREVHIQSKVCTRFLYFFIKNRDGDRTSDFFK